MNRVAALAAGVLILGSLAAFAREDEKAALPESVPCAVMTDHTVNIKEATAKKLYADHEYTRYYFCCAGCAPQFEKSPEKFVKNAGVPLTQIDIPAKVHCAVNTGAEVDVKTATEKGQFADYNGRRYYFCCGGCPAAFKKEPEKFAKNDSVAVGQLPLPKEVACAVMTGNQVNVAKALKSNMYADFKGRRYLFCCGGCPAAFKANPEKFAANASIPSPKREVKKTE